MVNVRHRAACSALAIVVGPRVSHVEHVPLAVAEFGVVNAERVRDHEVVADVARVGAGRKRSG